MIYGTLIQKVSDTIATVTAIKAIYAYPTTKVTQYPAVIFFPDSFDNSFESTKDNKKVYRFKLYVVVGAAQKDKVDIFSTVLPKAVDAVIAAFDAGWDAGTINGHRVSVLINSGAWSMAVSEEGLEATAELTVEFRLLTS